MAKTSNPLRFADLRELDRAALALAENTGCGVDRAYREVFSAQVRKTAEVNLASKKR